MNEEIERLWELDEVGALVAQNPEVRQVGRLMRRVALELEIARAEEQERVLDAARHFLSPEVHAELCDDVRKSRPEQNVARTVSTTKMKAVR